MFDNATTRRLAVMNLALRGIAADFGPEHADTFRRDRRLNFELRTSNFELGNGPPFNDSDWFRQDDDVRFSSLSASNGERAGVRCRNDLPPKGNANFAWVQHFIHHIAPGGAGSPYAPWHPRSDGPCSDHICS